MKWWEEKLSKYKIRKMVNYYPIFYKKWDLKIKKVEVSFDRSWTFFIILIKNDKIHIF